MKISEEAKNKFRKQGKILIIWKMKIKNEISLALKGFNTKEEAAEYLETIPYFIEKILKGKEIRGAIWKPNIFYKNNQCRYIVVYTEDWISYSEKMRKNRIDKLFK